MYKKLKIVKIDSNYCDYLREYDEKVAYNAGKKELRPFIGILFSVNECEYFAPLSSPKAKHKTLKNTLDIIKIKDGEYGIVNFNNMIPVTSKNYSNFNLNQNHEKKDDRDRSNLFHNQLRWLTAHKEEIDRKSKLLYHLYKIDKLPKNVKNRCCNFPLLEVVCQKYNKSK